jgi:CDP-diacylglycerol--glycerol-3-phosphate 3-phosphatidyltransferase
MRRDAPIAFQPQFPLYRVDFMTTANKITIARILMIPLFILMAIYYGRDKEAWQRWSAIAIFVAAAASDGIDGYIARRHNQRSTLGVILDPLADKGLLLAGIITLTFSNWGYEFPLWFPVLVIARDIIVVTGAIALQFVNGTVRVRPSWTGKVATVLQMIAIGMVMLQWNAFGHDLSIGRHVVHISFLDLPVALAGLFTAISGFGYVVDGIAQLQAKGHGDPRPWNES